MGGRGTGSGSKPAMTAAQQKTINTIAKKTRHLKNEQYRIVNENGEVVLEKRGDAHSVAATVGEKRDHMPGRVSIHNHPDGGTFSIDDLSDIGYGARAIVAAAPEGNYILTDNLYGQWVKGKGWHNMRDAMEAAGLNQDRGFLDIRREAQKAPELVKLENRINNLSAEWVKGHKEGAPKDQQDRLYAEHDKLSKEYSKLLHEKEREIVTKPYHDWFKKNAKKYGFTYTFIETKKSKRS